MNYSTENLPNSKITIILKSFIFELKLKEKRWQFYLIKIDVQIEIIIIFIIHHKTRL